MKIKTMIFALAFCVVASAASVATAFAFAADDANVGTWKLNESKSKIPAGMTKNTSVVYTAEGDSFKAVVEGVDGSGKPAHNEWSGKFDGKDYPVTGDPNTDTRAIKKVDDRHYQITGKKDGKPTTTGTITFSADGKTRTLVTHVTDAKGKKLTATSVFEKQ